MVPAVDLPDLLLGAVWGGRSTTLVLSLHEVHAVCTGGGRWGWGMGGGKRGETPVSRELGRLEFAHCSASCTIKVGLV